MKTVVGLFDQFEDAQAAVQALRDSGFSANDINMVASDENGRYSRYLKGDPNQKEDVKSGAGKGAGIGAVLGGLGGLLVGLGALTIPVIGPVIAAGPIATTLVGAGAGAVAGGIVGALVDMGVPEDRAKAYAEGIRRGGTLVTVQTQDQQASKADAILRRFNPVDIDQRAQQWKQGTPVPVTGERDVHPRDRGQTDSSSQDKNIPVTGHEADTTIPVVDEDLRVGKREVDRGGVRVESHTTEEPVEKDVNLRNEHVNVERRPVDRPATDDDFKTFQEGTMEFKEKGEEPVVEKRSRVVEEVHVKKDVSQDEQKVRDTVRHTDVNVERMGQDWNTYDQHFRQDYQSRFGNTQYEYNYYQPVYRLGYDLANNPQFKGYDWTQMEPIARREYQRRSISGSWQDMKDAVRYAWESAMNRG